jgi:hypothetical protein
VDWKLPPWAAGILLALTFALLAVHITYHAVRDHYEREAVEKGHAEFYFDKNFDRQWRWKLCPETPPVKE